jgi:hypothetical protein
MGKFGLRRVSFMNAIVNPASRCIEAESQVCQIQPALFVRQQTHPKR